MDNKYKIVAFDVDGTLIKEDPIFGEDLPRKEIIELYFQFSLLGCYMVVWSGGGKEYAEGWCRRLNIKPDEILCKTRDFKPDIAFDDEDVDFGI